MTSAHSEPKDFFSSLDSVRQELAGKELLLFLDYDGTLTPIVETPDKAILSEEMRQAVRQVAQRVKVSVVSGRATDDVRGKVQIEGLFYAGSHGFEIVSPSGEVTINQEALEIRAKIDEVYEALNKQVNGIPGVLIEHVKYTVSAHYRLVPDQEFSRFKQAVEDVLKDFPQLRRTEGKKVFEIRPKIDWDKGKAVSWILDFLHFAPGRQIAVYIGDDTTDEDAFAVLQGRGFGIFVATEPRPSIAQYRVDNTEAVKRILDYLMDI